MSTMEEHQGQQIDERVRILGRSAVDMAHDLKNLLFAITAYADKALAHSSYNSPTSQDLNCLLTITERASITVDQVLQFARPGKRPFKVFHLIPVLDEIVDMVKVTTPESVNVSSEYHCKYDLVLGNATQVYQCIMNLAFNSVYAMQKCGDLSIHLLEQRIETVEEGVLGEIQPDTYLVVDVIDNGKGIAPELVGKIFQPFFTTKKADRGSGLGLAILRDIMKQHLGNIQVVSSPQNGTRFRLLFPKVITQ